MATETGVAVIPLRGFDNRGHVEPFSWMCTGLLDDSVKVFVLLDRDYRAAEECKQVELRLRSVHVSCHVWKRKELESYLLDARAVARVTGADEDWVEEALAEAAEESEDDVFWASASRDVQAVPTRPGLTGCEGGEEAARSSLET